MSKYTTEVRFICETKSGFTPKELENKSVDEIIDASRDKIFNFVYPIYEEGHKPELEKKILKHYYTREIASETVGLWVLWLNEKLNLIMPKYNKLYKAEKTILDKELKNIDVEYKGIRTDDLLKEENYTRTDNLHEKTNAVRTDNLQSTHQAQRNDNLNEVITGTETRNLTDTHNETKGGNRKFSDTPQGSVTFSETSGVNAQYWLTDYTETQENDQYTEQHTGTINNNSNKKNTGTVTNQEQGTNTGTQKNDSTTDNTGTQKNDGTTANTGTVETENYESGYRGSKIYAELIEAYSQKVLNIDMMIVNDLRDLFFKLW